MADVLKRLGLVEKRTLLVLEEANPHVVKSCRNLKNLRTTLAHQLNAYDLLQSEAVILTAGGLARIQEVFAR
jgi:ribosomal protein L4